MSRLVRLQAAAWMVAMPALLGAHEQGPPPRELPRDGIYAVLRDGLQREALLPLRGGETVLVDHHRHVKAAPDEPPRFLVVRSRPDVALDLDGAPRAEREGPEVVRVLLTLRPQAAAALEKLTRDHRPGQVVLVAGGEVVSVHKVREVIRGGTVQITSCSPGGAASILERLQAHYTKR